METQRELQNLGHSHKSPLKAIRERCLDCCCGSTKEVRLCSANDCPNWPFRHGKNPWRANRQVTPRQLQGLKNSPLNNGEKPAGNGGNGEPKRDAF